MHLSVYLPLLFSGLFGACAPQLARRLPPAVGTWLLSVGGLLAAAGSAASLALLGFTLFGFTLFGFTLLRFTLLRFTLLRFTLLRFTLLRQSPPLADRGHWSGTALRHADPVAAPVAALALIVFAVLAVRIVAAGVRRLVALRDAYRLAACLPAAVGNVPSSTIRAATPMPSPVDPAASSCPAACCEA
jgi:hypothetical protein